MLARPDAAATARLIADADVLVHFWNHPRLDALLRALPFPPSRVLVWAQVLGTHAPQVLSAELASFADRLVLTSELSLSTAAARAAATRGIPIRTSAFGPAW